MATPHKYPTGRADFESIINEGFLYVDKTERMYEMIGCRKFVFLSRPRRFGKSLLVNTLHAYFEGKKIGVNVSTENNVRTITDWKVEK